MVSQLLLLFKGQEGKATYPAAVFDSDRATALNLAMKAVGRQQMRS